MGGRICCVHWRAAWPDPMLDAALRWPVESTVVFCCLWTRCTVMLGIAQVFGMVGNSRGLRLMVATIMALWLWPICFQAPAAGIENVSQITIALLLVKEAALGLFLGIVLALPVWMAEMVGAMFDNQRGAMTGQTFNPLLNSPSTMASLLQYAAVLFLYGSGALDWVFEFVILVARLWSPTSLLPTAALTDMEWMIMAFNTMAKGAVLYFAPLMAVMLMIETSMALMSVYAPHLQAFQMAMPIKSLIGLAVLALMISFVGDFWLEESLTHYSSLVARIKEQLNVR
jgi:type III secretion protein T